MNAKPAMFACRCAYRFTCVLALAAIACGCRATGIPGERTYEVPTPLSPILKGRLWCPDCADEGTSIELWQEAGVQRGKVVGKGNHGDNVDIFEKWYDDSEERYYYRVRLLSTGATGWVSEKLVQINTVRI